MFTWDMTVHWISGGSRTKSSNLVPISIGIALCKFVSNVRARTLDFYETLNRFLPNVFGFDFIFRILILRTEKSIWGFCVTNVDPFIATLLENHFPLDLEEIHDRDRDRFVFKKYLIPLSCFTVPTNYTAKIQAEKRISKNSDIVISSQSS